MCASRPRDRSSTVAAVALGGPSRAARPNWKAGSLRGGTGGPAERVRSPSHVRVAPSRATSADTFDTWSLPRGLEVTSAR
jgi:hypothetical protein